MNSAWPLAWEFVGRSTLILAVALCAAGICRRWLLVRQSILHAGVIGLLLLPFTVALPKVTWNVLPPMQAVKRQPSSLTPETSAKPLPFPTQREQAAVPKISDIPPAVDVHQDHQRSSSNARSHKLDSVVSATERSGRASPIVTERGSTQVRWTSTASLQSSLFWGLTYSLGVLLMIGRLLLGYWQLHLLRIDSAACRDAEWQAAFQQCRQQLGISRRIDLRASETATTPLTYGHWSPVLIVPISILESATPAERQAVLLHELVHIQRRDFGWLVVSHVVGSLYWFHPLLWWFSRILNETQEAVCDAICAAKFGTQSYSEMLVNVVRSVRRSPSLTLGLAMSRTSHLSRRLTRIQRQGCLTMSRLSHCVFFALLTLAIPCGFAALLVQPVRAQQIEPADNSRPDPSTKPDSPVATDKQGEPKSSENAAKKDAPKSAAPHVLVKLVTEENSPRASVTIKVRKIQKGEGFPTLEPQVIEAKADAEGLVAIPLEGIAADEKEIGLEIRTADCAPFFDGFEVRRTNDVSKPDRALLVPSLHLTTKAYDAEGRPLADGRVTVLADVEDHPFQVWKGYFRCDARGLLEMDVPRDKVFGFTVVSDRGAPYRVVYPAGTQKISDVYLQRGCVVAGQLLDREGKPIPKCQVVLEGEDSQAVSTEFEVKRHGGGPLQLTFFRLTDDQGRFKFPPMAGDVRLYLESDGPAKLPGIVVPVNVSLPASAEKWVPLMLAPTGTITGTVRWPDGKPAKNVSLELQVPPHKADAYISLSTAKTDETGHYSLIAPYPLEEAWITPSGLSGTDGRYHQPKPVGNPETGRDAEWKHVVQYLGAPLTVDWVMVPYESSGARESVEPGAPDANDPLAQMEHDLQKAYKAIREASTKEEKDRLDPRPAMLQRCLELEAKFRGSRVAIGALHYVMRTGAATLELNVSNVRSNALQILDQHYLKHPDVDLLLGSLDAGAPSSAAEPLLNHLVEQSPFDYVRATALFQLFELKRNFLRWGEHVNSLPAKSVEEEEALIRIQTNEDAREYLKSAFARDRKLREMFSKVDRQELRQSLIEMLDRIISQYTGVVTPRRTWRNANDSHDGLELHLVDLTEPETWRIRTIAERASIERFQFTRLQLGMNAPDIEGLDLQLRPIRLSQFRGKVVLLTATLGNVENKMYAECARLVKKFANELFACVSVIPGSGDGGYSIRDIVEEGKVTWPIIRDNHEDDISHNWCQNTFPVVYIIDQQGIIRHLGEGDSSEGGLESIIETYLKQGTSNKK